MRSFAAVALLLVLASRMDGATTRNDDSCDISNAPAATLLLPYFEVETREKRIDTLFSVTNLSHRTQIVKVTVWTDWSYPILTFPLILPGYAVASVSMYDVVVNGRLPPQPRAVDAPPACLQAPSALEPSVAAAVRSALTTGRFEGCGTSLVGTPASMKPTSSTAVGFVTIDVTSNCTTTLPSDPRYIAKEILFDNVLTGESHTIDASPESNSTTSNSLVHIRAVPEGGNAGFPLTGHQTNLPYTFYSRFINDQTVDGVTYGGTLMNFDRRQPLPSVFVARWIDDGTAQRTDFKIWRERQTGAVTCTSHSSSANLPVTEIVRFDSRENPTVHISRLLITSPPPSIPMHSAWRTNASGHLYPPLSTSGDKSGWMYIHLGTEWWPSLKSANEAMHPGVVRAAQGWVTVSMKGTSQGAGLFAAEFNATWLGNGCSGAIGISTVGGGVTRIGPIGGTLVCPDRSAGCTPGTPPYYGTNRTP